MKNILLTLATAIFTVFILGCSSDKPKSTLSGKVVNQSSKPISNVYVIITDSELKKDSVLTGFSGKYVFKDKPEGVMSISYNATTKLVNGFPNVINKDTTISFSSVNSVLNIVVREFNTIYRDNGKQATNWSMSRSVSNDGTKYIFKDEWMAPDKMDLINSYLVPENALDVNLLLKGNAGPASKDSGLVRVTIYKDNIIVGQIDKTFYKLLKYTSISLNAIKNIAGGNVSIGLEFRTKANGKTYSAANVFIEDIWIYNY